MDITEHTPEIFTVLFATIILAVSASFKDTKLFPVAVLSFLIIITANLAVKKMVAYHFEITLKAKFWHWYNFGFRKDQHFKKPLPMAWLPLITALATKGNLFWLGILEYTCAARPERASKRHGLYRFTEITERHVGWIAFWGVATTIILGIISYIAGFESFTKLSFYFAMWSVIPISRLDGTKILFANKVLWTIITIIASICFFLSFGL